MIKNEIYSYKKSLLSNNSGEKKVPNIYSEYFNILFIFFEKIFKNSIKKVYHKKYHLRNIICIKLYEYNRYN